MIAFQSACLHSINERLGAMLPEGKTDTGQDLTPFDIAEALADLSALALLEGDERKERERNTRPAW